MENLYQLQCSQLLCLEGESTSEKPIEAKVLYNTLKTPLQIAIEEIVIFAGGVIAIISLSPLLKSLIKSLVEKVHGE